MTDRITTPAALSERSDLKLSRNPVIRDIKAFIIDRTVGLVRADHNQYMGTGTLVSIDGRLCILTARHLIRAIGSTDTLGVAMPSPIALEAHRLEIRCTYRQRIHAKPIGKEVPDLGVLILTHNDAAIISSKKSFYNLTMRRREVLDRPPNSKSPIWVLAGTPDTWSRDGGPARAFESTREFTLLLGFGVVEPSSRHSDFNCLDFVVDRPEDSGIPKSFAGCSGGGLWHVSMPNANGIAVERPRLMGVVFEQTSTGSCKNTIHCVGSEVIYEHMIDIVRKSP